MPRVYEELVCLYIPVFNLYGGKEIPDDLFKEMQQTWEAHAKVQERICSFIKGKET